MHCLHGKYDYLVNDKFTLNTISVNEYIFDVPENKLLDRLLTFYISCLENKAVNLTFIYLIEASLFLSMIPLHYENTDRQKVFYLTGIIFLNNVLETCRT